MPAKKIIAFAWLVGHLNLAVGMTQLANSRDCRVFIQQRLQVCLITMEKIFRVPVRPALERLSDTFNDRAWAQIAPHRVYRNRRNASHAGRSRPLRRPRPPNSSGTYRTAGQMQGGKTVTPARRNPEPDLPQASTPLVHQAFQHSPARSSRVRVTLNLPHQTQKYCERSRAPTRQAPRP